jgi:hypothetical protein
MSFNHQRTIFSIFAGKLSFREVYFLNIPEGVNLKKDVCPFCAEDKLQHKPNTRTIMKLRKQLEAMP